MTRDRAARSTVAVSPDGTRVAYTVTETNVEENAYETEIFLASASGKDAHSR